MLNPRNPLMLISNGEVKNLNNCKVRKKECKR
jgi:hypothetical protein